MTGKPHIAILGRPNVGKSTLFNRLVGRRVAIVDAISGVTRDRIEGEYEWEGRQYRISDMAGWDEDQSNPFRKETTEQIIRIANEADLLILLVDGRDGPVAWDKAISEKLRVLKTPVVLAVNKCDTVKVESLANQFWEFGIGEPIPISATHNLNMDALLDRIAELTADIEADDEAPIDSDTIPVTLVGHQNAGKSTLFNALIGDKRAIVSDIPGTTRDAIDTTIEYDGTRFLFVDTAGLKKRTKLTDQIDYYALRRTENALARCHIALLLIDASEGVLDTDKKIAGIIQKAKRACIIIASKWDESEDAKGQRAEFEKHIREHLHFLTDSKIIYTSGLKNQGIKAIFPAIVEARKQFQKKLSTSEWNQALEDAISFRPPPSFKGKRLKLNYITQSRSAPPELIIFVNHPEFISDQYVKYLENFFRRRFGFASSPLIIHIRSKRKTGTRRRPATAEEGGN